MACYYDISWCVIPANHYKRISEESRTSEGAFLSLLIGRFVGVLSRGGAVFASVCLLVLMKVGGFCFPFYSGTILVARVCG